MHLVLIETAGNQAYIFASNKLREAVGASELTHHVGEEIARKAAQKFGAREIIATSGKALFLVKNEADAKSIVRDVTRWALEHAPGLDVRGVVGKSFDFQRDPIHEQVKCVHHEHELLAGRLPRPQQRFQRLPVVVECATSGLPASTYDRLAGNDYAAQSRVTCAKRGVSEAGLERMGKQVPEGVMLAPNVDILDGMDLDWLAIVHADGNGLGQMFLDFDELVRLAFGKNDNEAYVNAYREFSQALDRCTIAAFKIALTRMLPLWQLLPKRRKQRHDYLPVVPLILGGDDLTLVCDGRLALPFTEDFLVEFQKLTGAEDIIRKLAERRKDKPCGYLAACAGVAVVKPHFPFHAGYEMAEQLLKSAKKVKDKIKAQPVCALDYHIHYDASGSDLDDIRERLTLDDNLKTYLFARPYVVTEVDDKKNIWAQNRRIEDLKTRISTINQREDHRRKLSSGMLHELRSCLFLGQAGAEKRLQLIKGRHGDKPLQKLLTDGELFWKESNPEEKVQEYFTGLLDAMDLADFWPEEKQS